MFNNRNQQDNNNNEQKSTSKLYFYIAIGTAAAGLISFGLSFTVLKIYALIASILFEITSISFFNAQKRTNDFKLVFIGKIVAYVLFFAFFLFFIGGIVFTK